MSSPFLTATETSQAEIVDLVGLRPEQLENLWAEEKRLWQGELFWDTSAAISVIRDAVKRRSLAGRAIRIANEVVGCGYYIVDGQRAVLGGACLPQTRGLPPLDSHSPRASFPRFNLNRRRARSRASRLSSYPSTRAG